MKVAIVGGGPAGIFAALELADKASVTIIEAKPYLGGSGLHSDGKINFHPQIGGNLLEFMSESEAWELMKYLEQVFRKFGVTAEYDEEGVKKLARKAASAGIKFLPVKQAHVGSDNLPKIIKGFQEELEAKGVELLLGTKALGLEVENGRVKAVVTNKGKVEADFFLIAPGRPGAFWLKEIAEKLDLGFEHNPIDVGVRVEFPAEVLEPVVELGIWDPKFHIFTKSYDDFSRTFCTNPWGFVVKELYDINSRLVGVNGHAMRSKRSRNANLAILVRMRLTQPVTDTSLYGKRLVELANSLGGGKPLIQRLADLRNFRRSTWERLSRSTVEPTLKDVTPGDISMVYPHRVVVDILETLNALEKVLPGIASDSTLLYAPEIKFYAMRIKTSKSLQTKIPNLFVAGDGAGVSRGINGAAATGIIAARGMLKAMDQEASG